MKKEFFIFLKAHVFTLVMICILLLFSIEISKLGSVLLEIMTSKKGILLFYSLLILFYGLFLILRYFVRLYKKKGPRAMFIQLVTRFLAPVFLLLFVLKLIVYQNTHENFDYQWNYDVENTDKNAVDRYVKDGKHRGMSVYQLQRNNYAQVSSLVRANIEWVALFPYVYQKNQHSEQMNIPDKVGIWNKRDSILIESIEKIHKKGMHVMLKPHLWMSEGWRSNITLDSEVNWNTWFESYRKNVMHFAKMAELTNVELMCIGTELKSSVENQLDQWKNLITEIKEIYSGKLTYAANWDGEFDMVDFWDQLDYIGIQAYFPLTENKNPDLAMIKQGWDVHIEKLESISKKYHKPILFTEVGYRNDIEATIKPWEWGSPLSILFKKQSSKIPHLAYQALFEKLWHKEWFAGCYAWQWNSSDFPIKKTPSENTIAIWYSQNSATTLLEE